MFHEATIEEIGCTPIDRREANMFFNLVSELYERTSIIITSNKGFEEWAEMMGDEIMTRPCSTACPTTFGSSL